MDLGVSSGHGALDLGRLEQSDHGSFQLHGNQVKVAVAHTVLTDEGLKVVNLNFDLAVLQPQAKVLAGAVGQYEEKPTWLSGTNKHGDDHSLAGVVVQREDGVALEVLASKPGGDIL